MKTKTKELRDCDVFTTGQISKLCGVAPRTVTKWIDTGAMQGFRIPGSQDRRVCREALASFIKANNMPATMLAKIGAA